MIELMTTPDRKFNKDNMKMFEEQIYDKLKTSGMKVNKDQIREFLTELANMEESSTPEQKDQYIKGMVQKFYSVGSKLYDI